MNQPSLLLKSLKRAGILPVFKSNDLSLWQALIDICHNCGLHAMEFRDVREARGLKLFPFLIDYASRYANFQLGVSTIKPIEQCEYYLRTGAAFISSPFVYPALAELCHSYHRVWIPGCSDKHDVERAVSSRAQLVSLLPGALTAEMYKVIAQEYPAVNFIPSSGNDLDAPMIAGCIEAGALCIRREAGIFPAALTSVRDWRAIERLVLKELHFVRTTTGAFRPVSTTVL